MLPFAFPVILVFLIPVIGIEALYIRLRLRTGWRNTIAATTKANLVTMLLGFPLTWLIFFILEMILWAVITFSDLGLSRFGVHVHFPLSTRLTDFLIIVTSAAWMGPVAEKWAIPVAFVVLLIPSFVVSGIVESRLLDQKGWLWHEGRSTRAVWQANILSYFVLAVAGCLALIRFLK